MIDRREIPARAGRSFAARQCPLDQMRDLVGALVPRVDVDHTPLWFAGGKLAERDTLVEDLEMRFTISQ